MMKKKIWDYLAWIILALIVLWLILKVTGKINTSPLLEYSPLFGAVYLAGWAMSKLDRATDDIKEVKSDMGPLWDETKTMETDMTILRKKCPELK